MSSPRCIDVRAALLLIAAAVGASACGRAASPRPAGVSSVAAGSLAIVVDRSAGPDAAQACTAHPLRGVTEYWTIPADSLATYDARVVMRVDSVFALLRPHARFRQLGRATDYHRQYLGILFDGRPLVYVHGLAHARVQPQAAATRLVAHCDGGTNVIGLLIDPRSGALGRLEFGGGFDGRYAYDDIVPPMS